MQAKETQQHFVQVVRLLHILFSNRKISVEPVKLTVKVTNFLKVLPPSMECTTQLKLKALLDNIYSTAI